MNDPDILVLGRSGLLASALAERGRGAVVTVGRPDFDLASSDAPARLLDTLRPAAVINAAAYTAVDRAESEPELAFAINRDGPAALAKACARARVPLIHVSTDCVFDGTKVGAYHEADTPRPLNIYGVSKRAGERAVLDAMPSALVVRTSWTFGPQGESFVTRLLDWAKGRDSLTIVGDQRGKPTYAPALAEALLIFAHGMIAGSTTGGLMHLAGETALSRAEQAQIILDLARDRGGPWARVIPIPSSAHPTAARRPLNAVLDCTLAARRGIALGAFRRDIEIVLDCLLGPPLLRGAIQPELSRTS
ncbi:dTDP-4-dehydrorhamnose reductase [Bosea sp. NPDC055332]